MKKIYVLLFVTAGIILSAHAQPFEKGDKLLGGNLGINNGNSSPGSSNVTSIYVEPTFGFFTKPNRLTGFSLFFNSNNPAYKQRGFGGSVYKQYWNTLGKNIYFIMEGKISAGYNTIKYPLSSSNSEQQDKSYSLTGSLSPIFAYRINNKLIIDALFANFLNISDSYTTTEFTNSNFNSKSHTNNIRLASGLGNFNLTNIQLGFHYIFK